MLLIFMRPSGPIFLARLHICRTSRGSKGLHERATWSALLLASSGAACGNVFDHVSPQWWVIPCAKSQVLEPGAGASTPL